MKAVTSQPKFPIQPIINIFSVVGILFLLAYLFYFRNDKIAYVESAKIMAEYKGAIRAKKDYDAKVREWQSNIDTLNNEMQNSMRKYEKELSKMSAKEQELSRQIINDKQKQLGDYQAAIQDKARQEEGKLMQGVIAEVNAFLLKYGKDHNYKMILIASQSGTIAYAREGLDITSKVIEELNR
jgi:outer membrane protein